MRILWLAFIIITASTLIIILQFAFVFLLLAMMPALVAYFIDFTPRKTSFKIVFASNFSATLPTLVPVIKAGIQFRHIDPAIAFSDPLVWMFIYVGAGAGWCLIYLCGYAARVIVHMSSEHKIRALYSEQKTLLKEWGKNIAQDGSHKRTPDDDEA